ncbi:MAG TPA: hypothetical protein VG276_26475 [Actinomycetes bacterium]|jgi:hypothetical protein|nr:hypothetical protein [Actinomycetes bacterium]
MGYDMYRVLGPDEQDLATEYEGLRDWWQRPGEAAQRAALADRERLEREHGTYFRLNIFGMGRYRDAMERLGMVFWPVEEPQFPKHEAFGLAGCPDEDAGDLTPAERAYLDQVQAVTDGPCMEETPGIPGYKLASNDGWLVRPLEIRSALKRYHDQGEPVPEGVEPGYWAQWVGFLARCGRSGGFRVR